MKPVYDRVGCLLRVTAHDGLPRMIIEALLLGKYVIYSHHLDRFRRAASPNTGGITAISAFFTPRPRSNSPVRSESPLPSQRGATGFALF